MSTILINIDDNEHGYDKRLVVKGASEIVLGTCSHFVNSDGSREELTEEKTNELNEVISKFAKKSLRTICIAYKDLQENEGGKDHEEDDSEAPHNRTVEQSDLTCIAILGIKDVIRPEVPKAVETCQRAGIKVRMVTGDNLITAHAIAEECGILEPGYIPQNEYEVTTGPEFAAKVGGIKNPGSGEAEVVTKSALRNAARCCDSADWDRGTTSFNCLTDSSLPNREHRIINRLSLLMAFNNAAACPAFCVIISSSCVFNAFRLMVSVSYIR